MSNGTPPHNGGGWPPPRLRYALRAMAFAASAGAAAGAFSGHPGVAAILATMAAALLLVDIIGGSGSSTG